MNEMKRAIMIFERCNSKIRPFRLLNETEIKCNKRLHETGPHTGALLDYAYPGSATLVEWAQDDRRSFQGTWAPCKNPGCILPLDHNGSHVEA